MANSIAWAQAGAESVWADPDALAELDARSGPLLGSPASERRSAQRFVAEDADLIERTDQPSLVKRLLPQAGLCIVGAASMAGKTFMVLDLISKIAKGEDVLGRRSKRAGVVFFAAEGASGLPHRVEGLRRTAGPWQGMLRIVRNPLNLTSEDDVAAMRATLVAVANELAEQGERLGAVVIDTLAAAAPGIEENSSKDMGQVLGTLQRLALDLNICCIVVAHLGKDPERGLRGWSGLFANADTVILLKPPNDEGVRVGLIAKVKDGEAGEEFAFVLEQVDLGVDSDGDEVTTCVIRMTDVPAAPKGKPKRKSYAEAEPEEVLRAFDTVVRERPVSIPATLAPQPKVGVLLDDLKEHLFDEGFHTEAKPEDSSDVRAISKWKDARRTAFNRAVKTLFANRQLRKEGQLVWAP